MAQATLAEIPRPEPSDPDVLYEVIDGRIQELPPMGTHSTFIAQWLNQALISFIERNPIGWVVPECLFMLDPATDLRRRPDLAFVSFATWPADREIPEGDWAVVPDLAVEVISPNDLDEKVHTKLRDYFRAGVKRAWLIRPSIGMIYDYGSPKRVTIVEAGEEIDGGDLLPGFRVAVGPLLRRTAT